MLKPNKAARMPTLFLPHGGGPHAWDRLALWLRSVIATLPDRPRAVVVISAHWETAVASVTSRVDPLVIYDYERFPPETYALRYPAAGSPTVAERVQTLLGEGGIPSHADPTRGFDHGVFVPFLLVSPEGDIPIVALSLVTGLDPNVHLTIGSALAPLRDEGLLIAGSGMSFHNMGALTGRIPAHGDLFDAWLAKRSPPSLVNGTPVWRSGNTRRKPA